MKVQSRSARQNNILFWRDSLKYKKHDDPETLKNLCDLTGINLKDIPLNDSKVFEMINDITVLGIKQEEFPYRIGSWALPELGTNFTIQMLEEVKPSNMTEMIYFAGLSHRCTVPSYSNIWWKILWTYKCRVSAILTCRLTVEVR